MVGVDWRTPLDRARRRVPAGTALQGNLDPALVVAGWEATRPAVDDVLRLGSSTDGGHVFNLGHGVLPETDPEVLERVVQHVHATTAAGADADG